MNITGWCLRGAGHVGCRFPEWCECPCGHKTPTRVGETGMLEGMMKQRGDTDSNLRAASSPPSSNAPRGEMP